MSDWIIQVLSQINEEWLKPFKYQPNGKYLIPKESISIKCIYCNEINNSWKWRNKG